MFLTELILAADPEPDIWVLAAPLVWRDDVFGLVEVPCGFRTDMASIPRVLRGLSFLDPNGLSRRPACVHDWLYAWRGWGKARADNFLRFALFADGCSPWACEAFYYGVHCFGMSSWNSDAGALGSRDFVSKEAFDNWRWPLPGYSREFKASDLHSRS